MIVIERIGTAPARQLTAQERATGIILELATDTEFIYYQQGDEVPVFDSLDELKAQVRGLIDEQTKAAIYAGFTFDGVLFSMSDQAQINWTNLPNLPETNPATKEAVFPLSIYGKNDDPYSLTWVKKPLFYLTALAHKNGHLQTGNSRKGQVNECADFSELQALAATFGIKI